MPLDGGGVVLLTVTVIGVEVVRFPATSLALEIRVCIPLETAEVFQRVVNGAVSMSAIWLTRS